ncbi:MAG: hypothetical protein WCH43_10665 [Verrucomicrobiota bacterium]
MKKQLFTLSVVLITSAVCLAGTKTAPINKLGKDKMVTPTEELFRANEFDLGIFGAVGLGNVDHSTNQVSVYNTDHRKIGTITKKDTVHHAWGGGGEVDYFFTRYFGLGAEGDWLAGHDAISSVSGNVIGRYPFEYGSWAWAPYGFIGGGGQFDSQNAGYGQIGLGAEVRFKSHWGLFTDGRWVIHDSFTNYALIRTGVRINF